MTCNNSDVEYSNITTTVNHPYIHQLPDILATTIQSFHQYSNIKCVIYRLNQFNGYNFVEFYMPNLKLLTVPIFNENITNDVGNHTRHDNVVDILQNKLTTINGTKRYKGYIIHNNEAYAVIQLRNNRDIDDWVVIWDILANKHLHGSNIDETLVNFFTTHCKLSQLYINDKLCISPIVLYYHVPDNIIEYISKYKTCQYTQRDNGPLIKLHQYHDGDNVRNLCFITDVDTSTVYSDLELNEYIKVKEHDTTIYVFKHDLNILPIVK